jgi:hypothetical protein
MRRLLPSVEAIADQGCGVNDASVRTPTWV